jgi:hypothetical protein
VTEGPPAAGWLVSSYAGIFVQKLVLKIHVKYNSKVYEIRATHGIDREDFSVVGCNVPTFRMMLTCIPMVNAEGPTKTPVHGVTSLLYRLRLIQTKLQTFDQTRCYGRPQRKLNVA